jgi:hypothetical protein
VRPGAVIIAGQVPRRPAWKHPVDTGKLAM